MYYSKNKFLRKYYIVWCFVVFTLVFISDARANDMEITSLFTQADSKNEAVANVAIPVSYQDVIINVVPLKTESEKYDRIRMDFLDQSVITKRTKFFLGPGGSSTWIGEPENVNGSVIMSVCRIYLLCGITRIFRSL
jgi:hypothetical protein